MHKDKGQNHHFSFIHSQLDVTYVKNGCLNVNKYKLDLKAMAEA